MSDRKKSLKVHSSITEELLLEAAAGHALHSDYPGFCISCGFQASGVEPDARRLKCERCGEMGVFGAEELVLMVMA